MKRVILAFCLIGTVMAYSAAAVLIIRSESRELIEVTDEIIEYNKSGDSEKASEAAVMLNEKWHEFERSMSVFVRDDKLNNLSASVARVEPYIQSANDELEAELQNVRRQLTLIYRSELPAWYNIL
ncbi:MAG: DUF4363 family protein [Oscillospiraceae bacterium]|nr:DUF4363 family protein [Oscillospiraceae bacterium]